MEFSVNRADLARELGLSQAIVDKKTTIPVLSNVLIEAKGDRVVLTATDLELAVRSSCPARVHKPGAGTVPARKLLDYVALLPEGEVHFKFLENQWATLVSGRSRTRIAGISAETFPELPEMPQPIGEVPLEILRELIDRVIFAVSAEESRFTLGGALLILRDAAIAMVATDGHRLAYAETDLPPGAVRSAYRVLVPRKAMQELRRLAQDGKHGVSISLAGDENHVFFQAGERLLISRKLAGSFPDYERVLPREHPHSVIVSRTDLLSAIQRVQLFSDERSRAVRLHVSAGEIKVHSTTSDTGESEESVPAEYQGSPLEISFNAQYLTDFLKPVPNEKVQLHFKDPQSAGEMNPHGEPAQFRYRYIVMPMRI